MKKGLSVLLIAAALFGFYGGVTDLNDVLACRSYWETESEKATADMNKLADNLTQLNDSEQDYLDRLDTVADGEKKLSDGEADLEEGRKTLAEGEKAYAEAPDRLRDAAKKIAAGRTAYGKGLKDLAKAKKSLDEARTMQKKLRAGIKELNNKDSGYAAWKTGILQANKVAGISAFKTDGSLDANKINDQLETLKTLKKELQGPRTLYDSLESISKSAGNTLASEEDPETDAVKKSKAFNTFKIRISTIAGQLKAGDKLPAGYNDLVNDQTGIDALKEACSGLKDAIDENISNQAAAQGMPGISSLAEMEKHVNDSIANCRNLLVLAAAKKEMQQKLLPLLEKAKDNDILVKKIGGKTKTDALLKNLDGDDMQFMGAMDQVIKIAPELLKTVSRSIYSGDKAYAAGVKKLAAGNRILKTSEAALAQGRADYASAPEELAEGRKALADGLKKIMDGRKVLAAGKERLVEYEDGEQQARDQLGILMSTEAAGGLDSILERRGGDDRFDDADDRLNINEGLEAVDTGRDYHSDMEALIAKEITARTVGAGAGLAAAVFAVIAALLSLRKKNKGAAVLGCMAAVSGLLSIAGSLGAGSEFSDIAGSGAGLTPLAAASVLAVTAVTFAIAHIASGKEA